MAASQIFNGTADPSGGYVVIDNGSAQTFPALSAGTHLGYDNTVAVNDFAGGAVNQGANAFKNGNIPAFLATGTTSVINSALTGTRVLFKNPC